MKNFTKHPKYIKAATTDRRDLSFVAETIADDIADFLDATASMPNLDEYLDEFDIEALSNSADALYFFAQSYNHGHGASHNRSE